MSIQKITFDTSSGVPFASHFSISGGSNFNKEYQLLDTSKSPIDIDGWSTSGQIAKSVAIGATLGAQQTFAVGITSAADGKFKLSLTPNQTSSLDSGRYVYDVLLNNGSTTYKVLEGNIVVNPGISSSP